MTVLTISIGNSDDKLTQAEWAQFWADTDDAARNWAVETHGVFLSQPSSRFQNACWVLDTGADGISLGLEFDLARLAHRYRQDSIAVTVGKTQFISPEGETPNV